MRVLIFGASGLLGNAMFRTFTVGDFQVFGTCRSLASVEPLAQCGGTLLPDIDVNALDSVVAAFDRAKPDLVVNCVGVVKQLESAANPLHTIPINSILPHRLAALCGAVGGRLVHVSTDCVFSGSRGMYTEEDTPDALDLYGRSKLMGRYAETER